MSILRVIEKAIVLYGPVFLANAVPVVAKGKLPMDFNKTFIDGRRIFGKSKTIEGFISGIIAGVILGVIISIIKGDITCIAIAFISSTGGLIGDTVGAFIKRRLRMVEGSPAPILDQLDFVLGATLLLTVMGVNVEFKVFIIAVISSLVLHVLTNRIAYILKLKNVPW